MATDRRRAAATTLTGAALLSAGGGLRHEGVRRAVDGGTYPRVHLSALKGAKRGKGLYLAGTAVGTVGAAALGSGLLNLTRRKDVDKRQKTPLWQEGVAGTADALRDRKASLTTSAPPKARGTQLAIAGGSAAVGSALARLAMRHSSGRTKALVTPIAGALAATASVPLSSRAVQRSTKGEYVVTPTGVRRAKDVIKKPSTKAHMVSSRHGPLRSQVVPSDDRFAKADSFGVQRAKITAAGSTPIVGPYAQAHLAAHYAPAGQKRKAALRQFAMGPAAGMAAGVGAAYGGAALARHHTGVGTKAESALQWRSDKVNAVRNKIGLGDTKPLAETSLRGRALLRAKANRLAAPIMHNRGTAAAAAVGFLGTRALVSGIGGQAAISLNQRDQRTNSVAKALNAKNQARVLELSRRIVEGPNSLLRNQFNHRDEWVPSPVERVHELHWKMNKPSRFEQAAQRGRTPWSHTWVGVRTAVRQDRALDRQMRGLKVSPVRDRAKPRRVGKLDIGGRRENRREKHKLADTKRLNADLATASGATNLASLGLLASRHKAKAIPLSIIGSGIGGTNALIGAHVQRREAHAIDPVKKAFPRVAQAVHSAGLDVTDAGARKLSGYKGAYATFRAVPAAKYRRDGTVARRHAKASRLNAGSVVAGLAAPKTDPAALATAALATKVGSHVGNAGWKLGELPTRQERLSAKGGAKHGAHDWRFSNDKPGSEPRRRHYPITSSQDKPNWDGTFGKGHLPELPLAHREHLTFVKKSFAPVRKSFVNSGVKRAINLSMAERAAVRAKAGTGARGPLLSRGTSPKDNPINEMYAHFRRVEGTAETGPKRNVLFAPGEFSAHDKNTVGAALPRKVKRPMMVHAAGQLPVNSGLGFASAGTSRASHLLIHANDPAVITHEAAHAMPQRNAMRIAGMDPLQRAREEGRADATAMRFHGREDATGGDYDMLPRIRRQADAGDARSKLAMSQVHGALASERAAGVAPTQAGSMSSTYQTRAQSREYMGIRRKLGKPIGPAPVMFGKDVGADHRDLLRRYGDRGPLPKNIDRDEKMRAYEARYAAHGGKKGEKWQHRANVAEGVRNIALGTGTAALAGLAALKTKRGMAHVARHPIHQHRLDALALASGAVGGGAELYGELARDRRASYASSPGGVAASALTRMRQNTPGGAR